MKEPEMRRMLERKLPGKRILITGGLGMLGSTLAHLCVKYRAKVTIVDACIEPYGANMFNLKGIKNRVKVNKVDIRDKKAIKSLVQNQDIIFNLAAQVSHNDSISNPFLDADINYLGHLNVLECVKKYNPKAKILFSGSRLQFGTIENIPVNETHPLRPKTPYALNKTAAENMYKFYNVNYGIQCVIFRIANPYGPRCQMEHSKYSIVNYFIKLAMHNKEIKIFGTGNQVRDYIHVDDLAYAFVLAAIGKGIDEEVFNVGSGMGTKFKDMVKTVLEVVGKGKIKHVPWPENYINVETGDYVTDIRKISKVLGWHPRISFKEGIKKTHQYYLKYGKYYF